METIDDEVLTHALDFIDRQQADGVPFFAWVNTTDPPSHLRGSPGTVDD